MGIIANTKQYLVKTATNAAIKSSDGVAKAATLSPRQVQQVDEKRSKYLADIPDMKSDQAQDFINRNLGAISIEVYQAYLEQLKTMYLPIDVSSEELDTLNRIRYFDITKWVSDPTEKNLDKLVNVYQVLSKEDCNIALIYNRLKSGCQVVMAVSNTDEDQCDPAVVDSFYSRLSAAIKGNFPGVEIKENTNGDVYGYGIPSCLKSSMIQTEQGNIVKSVATVSNLVSDKSENFVSQSMEKLLDGIVPESGDEEYTIVLLAKPIADQLNSRNRLFELYTALSPYSSWQTNYGYSESDASNSSATIGVNLGLSAGRGGCLRNPIKEAKSAVSGAAIAVATEGACSGSPNGGGSSGNYHLGANFGANFARASTVTVQIGKNEGITQSYTNFSVKHTLEILEKQLERIDASSALGMWEFASYVISRSPVIANNVAHMYLALTQGEGSYMTSAAVHLWDGEEENDQATAILKSVQTLRHPVFGLKDSSDDTSFMYPTLITPSTLLSGKELAKALNFPRKSVSGLPVFECVPFGREVILHSEDTQKDEMDSGRITLGSIYHMRTIDNNTQVGLFKDSLTAHTFITGSTGAGKSNAVYTMLNGLCPYNKEATEDEKKAANHFLVIEPAKGEYKDVFGGRDDVEVYGTNPKKAKLLLLNPFSFPDDTHVLEHIDRLIEVFNACWPMFAAMPAVLKASIETAYINCGWNLQLSTCSNGAGYYPTFRDVMKSLPEVVDSKGFSNDTQGDYKGALLTRLESLTNGINGQVLCASTEISDEELFDRNVIIDLSRVSSSETKALLMGILVLKLQEHRMDEREKNKESGKSHEANKGLRHVTVLEEAHNLLRRTSSEQSQESANLQGKSVEMLTNAIAEMRTYGEGFIIADQAPGLLDMAVIRNTNTKIILRLPDESDRKLVGKSAGLNDNQIVELSRLDTGVAAVYQNHWLEPVLCKITEFKKDDMHQYDPSKITQNNLTTNDNFFRWLLNGEDILDELGRRHTRRWLEQLDAPMMAKQILVQSLETNNRPNDKEIHFSIYALTNGARLIENSRKQLNPEAYVHQQIQEMLQVHADQARLIQEQIYYYVLENKKPMEETLDSELRRVMMIR